MTIKFDGIYLLANNFLLLLHWPTSTLNRGNDRPENNLQNVVIA